MLIIVVSFITLAHLKQLIYKKILFLKSVGIYKKYCPKIQSIHDSLFKLFLFSIYKMAENMSIYKSFNINIATLMKNPEMLIYVPDHLKTKKMCKHAVKKFLINIRLTKCVIKLF